MTTGTGWCFGGPAVTDLEANAAVVAKTFKVPANTVLKEKLDPKTIQALVAFGPDGKPVDLASKVGQDGSVSWTAPGSEWTVYAISQRPSGQKVKRAAPGGGGHMLNLLYARGVSNFLASVDSKLRRLRRAVAAGDVSRLVTSIARIGRQTLLGSLRNDGATGCKTSSPCFSARKRANGRRASNAIIARQCRT